ncbi:MAG: ABC transporter substrate-binding protein [Bacteroidetes bacterium]|nr:ABC transporter substrate-binding protein [Bacteroidota bacterium]
MQMYFPFPAMYTRPGGMCKILGKLNAERMQTFAAVNRILILMLLFLASGCGQSGKQPAFPAGMKRIPARYSSLFFFGTTPTDTFLFIRDPADTLRFLNRFYYGKSSQIEGFLKLKRPGRIVALSAVFTGMLEGLDMQNTLLAVDNTDYITSPRTVQRIGRNEIVSVAAGGGLQREKLLQLKPDLVVGYYIDPKGHEELQQLEKAGAPVLYCQNFLENDPLARAEWIKVFGWLGKQSQRAEALFNEVDEHYQSLRGWDSTDNYHPGVIINAPYHGVWDAPAGGSYMARLIADAGGNYLFAHTAGTGRIPLNLEKIVANGNKAEVWLNPGACADLECLLLMDKRLSAIEAFQNKKVYNCTKTLNSKGGNAYWEYGVMRPDLVLADLCRILHPGFLPEHEFVFYEPLK